MEFDDETVQAVWEKGRATSDKDSTEWRKDECGAWIRRNQYDKAGEFGWKIVNLEPSIIRSTENLRPYHHENTFDKANDQHHCKVTADRRDLPPTATINKPRNKPAD